LVRGRPDLVVCDDRATQLSDRLVQVARAVQRAPACRDAAVVVEPDASIGEDRCAGQPVAFGHVSVELVDEFIGDGLGKVAMSREQSSPARCCTPSCAAPQVGIDDVDLAAALRVGVDEMITYDVELAAAASAAGVAVLSPS
jgi:hypothetical protein